MKETEEIKEIPLKEVLELGNLKDYKLHLATVYTGGEKPVQPLDAFLSDDKKEWHRWNRWRGDLNRKYILAFVNLYEEDKTSWLFAGVYEMVNKNGDENDVKECKEFSHFKKRLKITFKAPRQRYLKLENCFNKIKVREITKNPITFQDFKNYENINLPFEKLKIIIDQNIGGWKIALKNIKGVYSITDSKNGKIYIGSAYGDYGIWSRWECYIKNGHGGNADLRKLIKNKGFAYVKNFKFTLLEHFTDKTDKEFIINRETFWKKVFLTREFGYNQN